MYNEYISVTQIEIHLLIRHTSLFILWIICYVYVTFFFKPLNTYFYYSSIRKIENISNKKKKHGNMCLAK